MKSILALLIPCLSLLIVTSHAESQDYSYRYEFSGPIGWGKPSKNFLRTRKLYAIKGSLSTKNSRKNNLLPLTTGSDAVYEFPNTWPGAPSMNEASGAYYRHLLVPTGTTGSSEKQTNDIVYYRISETDVRDLPFVWRFTDTGTGVFGGKLEYRVIGAIHRDQ